MISVFRNFAKSKWAAGLLVLVGVALLIGGAKLDVFSGIMPKHIIDAGSRTIDAAEFRSDFDRARESLQERAGRPLTTEDLVKENVHVRYLEQRTQELGFLDWAHRVGIRPGKALVIKQIRAIPAFFNSVTGQFDEQQYQSVLAEKNYTPVMIERELRDQYTSQHAGTAVMAGYRVPRIYGALLAGRAMETRDGRWFMVTPAMVGATPAPTDAQLQSFISDNAAQLRRPEFRMVSVVLFSPSAAASTAAIPEARIVERFNFKKDSLSTPETRTFVTLTAPTKAAADKIAAALRAGQSPADAGKANGDIRPADFNNTPRSAVSEPAVAAAVFGMQPGQVSDAIQGRVGFTVAKLTSATPGHAATLEDSRAALVQELRAEDAKAQVFSKVEQYEKARSDGKTLDQAVAAIGARIIQLPPVTQDGKLPNGQAMNAPPQLLTTAWTLSKGGESDVIDAGQGQYFVLRLDDIKPAALPTLNEVRAPLTQAWIQRENARRIAAKADELAGRVRGGQDIAAVASSAGATLITRGSAQQNQQTQTELGEGVLQGLFGQGKGQVFSGPAGEAGFVVGRVDNIHAAVPALAAPVAEQLRVRMGQNMAQGFAEQAIAAAARSTKAKNDPALALQALGVAAPAAGTPAGSAPTAPAPAQ
ncbi:peptidylprolyl isomerase [Brevundimonas goettingensis]|uniref:Parvulin-like PPIase n=1 Tax=Brevundimonas goettingensis TaxID=2774190 RepID=A0A975C2B3_9CAUL|nr:peptidylprolyl isomerase [Brevundimonas goettingensis]QTC92583.1 peptidyl-prolyl cis-trans isomerase [Brevundimonas goettingensis]